MSVGYEGLQSFLNLEAPCLIRGTDEIGYPSLLHAFLGVLTPDRAEKSYIADNFYTVEEIEQKLNQHKTWTPIEADNLIRLFVQKCETHIDDLLCYVKDDEVIKFSYDPYRIFNQILHKIRLGKNLVEIEKELEWDCELC